MDIVERLRKQGEFWPKGLANEAADEIERLRKALWNVVHGWDVPVDENWKPVFRKVWEEARSALQQKESE